MYRSWMLALTSALLVSFSSFSQTPLPADANTIALWNFDNDNGSTVADTSGNNVTGEAYYTELRQIQSGGPLQYGRYFVDQRSHIRFGQLTPTSPLNLMAMNEWSIEFVNFPQQYPGGSKNIFDNGQVTILLQDLRYVAQVDVNGIKYGVKTANTYPATGVSRSIAVVYSYGKLGILVNGRLEGMTEIPVGKKSKATFNQLIRVGGMPTEGVVDYFPGRNHACLKNELGDVKCWGNDDNGQLGDHTIGTYYPMPVLAEGLTGVSQVSLGERFTCALRGSVVGCWGQNQFLSLGTAQWWNPVLFPETVQGLTNAVSVASGLAHSCSLTSDKKVYCWGKNDLGQLGQSNYSTAAYAAPAVGVTTAKQVAVGGSHSCALLDSNDVYCWGKNNRGQVGQLTASYANVATPMQVSITNVKQVVAGDDYSCALKNDDTVWCWGANEFGQHGTGSLGDSANPVQVTGLPNTTLRDITASNGSHTCVTTTAGRPWCWGRNDRGQLWIPNTTAYSTTPVSSPIPNAVNYKSGGRNNCYLRVNEKALYCSGSNSFGLLGDFSPVAYAAAERYVLSTRLGQFGGILDDIRVSNVARYTLSRPSLSFIGPTAPGNNPRPVISISVDSAVALDMNTLSIKLNGQTVSGLVLNGVSLEGQLSSDLIVGKNTIEVQVRDTQGSLAFLNADVRYYNQANFSQPFKLVNRSNNACYLTYGGELWCWGSNEFGQLGNATQRYLSSPTKYPHLDEIVDFTIARSTICALVRSGSVHCWGDNSYGQLGDGGFKASLFPVKAQITDVVTKLVGDANSFCAVTSAGIASCWGENNYGKFGLNGYNVATPTVVPGVSNVTNVAIGYGHACFITSQGQTFCAGINGVGQLGDGTNTDRPNLVLSSATNLSKISAKDTHTCGVNQSNAGYCWGKNNYRELGGTPSVSGYYYSTPQAVVRANPIQDIEAGLTFSCALGTNQQVTCWGQNTHGEMGNGTRSREVSQYTIPGLSFDQLSVGDNTVCGLTTNQEVYCWGANTVGQAGNANGLYSLTPTLVQSHAEVTGVLSDLEAGQANTCLRKDGQLICSGNNEQGQFGHESGNFTELYPVALNNTQGALQFSVGYALICNVSSQKRVWCSGFNNFGQAGQNPGSYPRVDPTQQVVNQIVDYKSVAAGLDFACALTESGVILCWGANNFGQLGRTGGNSYVQSQVVNSFAVTQIDVAQRGYHGCGLTTSGQVGCWGSNSNGQVGDRNNSGNVTSFFKINEFGFNNKQVSLGAYFTCVLNPQSKVVCFGSNTEGQLGIGTDLPNGTFEPVELTNTVVKVSAGENHVCALDSIGDVYCWGKNDQGQLGNGTRENSSLPIKIMSNVAEVSAGSEHTCALTTQNKLVCWGFNGNGQFGNGTNLSSLKPVFSDVTKK